ncbi:hypothetical protein [Rubrivivax albus]|uniref:Response regulator n=1 Tax=Rubrivivax albus TaxID=2499835 RepID=A0A437JRP7_9BURK|nr:hypothetical protein [Rubrivivax albus]RVT49621.1 hypothetical protein ENE75_18390 [Rubrivivax albus]
MSQRILLARPHAFIVNEMRPFLLEAGFSPVKPESKVQLLEELGRPAQGIVISTAVSSNVEGDAEAVFRWVREKQPNVPVAFAGMTDARFMRLAVEQAVKALVHQPVITGAADYLAAARGHTRSGVFLFLRKDDLSPGAGRQVAMAALRAHFA